MQWSWRPPRAAHSEGFSTNTRFYSQICNRCIRFGLYPEPAVVRLETPVKCVNRLSVTWNTSGGNTACMLIIYLPLCSSKFNSCSHLRALRMERRDVNQRGRPEEEAEPQTMTPVIAAVREEICSAAITVRLLFTCSAGMFAMRFHIVSGIDGKNGPSQLTEPLFGLVCVYVHVCLCCWRYKDI